MTTATVAGGRLAAAVVPALDATTLRHASDYRDHEALGRAIVLVNPSSWLGHNHLGSEALRRGEFAAALDHLGRAEQIAPGRIETQVNLALARMNVGDLAGAEEAARRAVSIRDGAAIAYVVLGDALLRAERLDEAVASYVLEHDPRLPRALGLGLAQSRAGRLRPRRDAHRGARGRSGQRRGADRTGVLPRPAGPAERGDRRARTRAGAGARRSASGAQPRVVARWRAAVSSVGAEGRRATAPCARASADRQWPDPLSRQSAGRLKPCSCVGSPGARC